MVRGMSLISPCFRDGSRIGVVQAVVYERGNLEEMESKGMSKERLALQLKPKIGPLWLLQRNLEFLAKKRSI